MQKYVESKNVTNIEKYFIWWHQWRKRQNLSIFFNNMHKYELTTHNCENGEKFEKNKNKFRITKWLDIN